MAEGLTHIASFRQTTPLRVVSPDSEPLSTRSDESLMLEHAAGSDAAFEELVRRHQKGVLNYMYRMIQNRHVAEELTQETFLALVRNAQRYQPLAKFTTYLYSIASNIVSKEWSRAKRRPKLFSLSALWGRGDSDGEDMDPLEALGDERSSVLATFQRGEVSEAVNAALQQIPSQHREAFVLLRFQHLSYDEIAAITDTPVGTIKSRVVRAERALRPLLERFREYVTEGM